MSIFQKAADKIDSVKNNMAESLQDKYYTIYQDICIPPPRSIYDFLSTKNFSSGFGLPDFKDTKRWNNRIQKNLHYYQIKPLFFVIAVMAPIIVPKYYPIPNKQHESIIMASGPMIVAGIMFATFSGILYGFMWNLIIMLLIFIHASLRLRNIDNKISNTVGKIARRRTVMSEILDILPDYAQTNEE
ncbi:Jwa ortholog [Strongyloides ratti]|uniref:Jwa ortholog n=1 Tax=Strongyloides ratti TaxID=34506 RepID=A0A090LVF1_STRRB|nr:Jwa ortholog [Strongyloides ratti]CEF71639.1 Jwa ortholog [Strongyloides ratti]